MFLFSQFRMVTLLSLATIALGGMIAVNSSIYFQAGPEPAFLIEKGELRHHPVWRSAFYFHIVSASVCLIAGAFLMFPRMLRFPRAHKSLGYIYLNCVLWFAAPSGLMMAPFAKFGILAAIGFAITGALWWWATWLGYRSIREHDIQSHIRWMVRSYAIALTAPVFRLMQIGLYLLNFSDASNYILSIWLSLAVAIYLSESCIARNLSSGFAANNRAQFLVPHFKGSMT